MHNQYALAPDALSLIQWMVDQWAEGNFNIRTETSGGRSFNTLRPEKYHFLDSAKLLFGARAQPSGRP